MPEFDVAALAPFSLRGQAAVITGAGSGIGRATAVLFAAAGARVALAGRNGDALAATRAQIDSAGGEAIAIPTDVSDEHAVRRLFDAAAEAFGALTVSVHSAAHRPKADFMQMSMQQWDTMLDVNARGTFLCMREAVRCFRAHALGGAIVNISSVGSLHPVACGGAHYDASKGAINALTRTAAMEFAPERIRVNAVLPGSVDTEAARAIRASGLVSHGPITQPSRRPMGVAQPEQMAHAILFLASPASSYVTGHLLVADGGFTVT